MQNLSLSTIVLRIFWVHSVEQLSDTPSEPNNYQIHLVWHENKSLEACNHENKWAEHEPVSTVFVHYSFCLLMTYSVSVCPVLFLRALFDADNPS